LRDGSQFGLSLSYAGAATDALILGDNIFYGHGCPS
jgi:hypothetical protein